jgi:hypothetical protein
MFNSLIIYDFASKEMEICNNKFRRLLCDYLADFTHAVSTAL